MAPFRLPEKHLAMFKALCNATAQHLPNKGSVPLLGRKLYNRFSEALGHKDFNALQQDARQYGNGHFLWHEFAERLKTRLHQSLRTELDPTVAALAVFSFLVLDFKADGKSLKKQASIYTATRQLR